MPKVGIIIMTAHSTLIVAPAGAWHLAHSFVAALEKGMTIACELRLAMNQMTHKFIDKAHSQCLKVTVH